MDESEGLRRCIGGALAKGTLLGSAMREGAGCVVFRAIHESGEHILTGTYTSNPPNDSISLPDLPNLKSHHSAGCLECHPMDLVPTRKKDSTSI